MLNFLSVEWKNFLSTGNASNTIFLNRSTSTLIIGKNGHGKSSMMDALTFGLFGKPFRNIAKGQLINSINGKGCLVTVNFEVAGKNYKVVRGIKPTIFEIWCDGEMINQDAASRDYQKVLEQQILKLTYKSFTQVVILGSASFVPFMQLSSANRREVIEDILDIRVFSLMNQILKEKIVETKESLLSLDSDIRSAKDKVEAQQKIINTLAEAKSETISTINLKIAKNLDIIAEEEAAITALHASISELREKISDIDTLDADIMKAQETKTKFLQKLESCRHDVDFLESNTTCPSCTQELQPEHKRNSLATLTSQSDKYNDNILSINTALSKMLEKMEQMTKIGTRISALQMDVSTKTQTISILMSQNRDLEREIKDISSNTGNLDDERAILKQYAQSALININKRTELQRVRSIEDAASALLKDSGIKTAIIREYLPIMNKLINRYLASMDTYIHFEFDEAFNEKILSRHRDDFTYASFSEGEKQKIDLAILFAWRALAAQKNSVNTNLLIMDEIFDSSLDAASTELLLALLGQFHDAHIFVISHKSEALFDKFRSVIQFEKRNEFSVIV